MGTKFKDGKKLVGKYINGSSCLAIYKVIKRKVYLIWQSIMSCFGGGSWDNEQPWDNDDGWNNG